MFKVNAYIFGGIFLIAAIIRQTIVEFINHDSYGGFIFGPKFVLYWNFLDKEGLKKRKELSKTEK
ncbi:MAG: hypothetical protein KA322_00035 [Chitinophagales bacterium]|nr:hypothetical protein [Chitinophagales bacterium]